jgi:hypothetical protein
MLRACKLPELDKQQKSWRDDLPIHPAAELFPLMSPDELRLLGADIIEQNELTSSIVLWRADPKSPLYLLDGRNRLDAIELVTGKKVEIGAPSIMAGDFLATDRVIELDGRKLNPWTYVVSANIHRRHLTAEQKREVIAKLLKAQPEQSNRRIADQVKVDDKTVGAVRAELEGRAEIPHVSTRTDSKGRQQPAEKKSKKQPAEKEPVKESAKESAKEPATTSTPVESVTAASRGDVGADSAGEIKRLEARNEELENQKRQLEIKLEGYKNENAEFKTENKDLKAENADLKAENAELRAKLDAMQTVTAEKPAQGVATAPSTEIATADTVTFGDPGPNPKSLQRKPKATKATKASNSSESIALGDAVARVFRELKALGCECREQADNTPANMEQRIDTLYGTASTLEDLSAPDIPAELAEIKVDPPKHHKPRTRRDRLDVEFGILAACMKALGVIGEDDTRHQKARALCGELQNTSVEIESCEF